MAYIKTLTVNGKTYTIRDPEAILCGAQALTDEQKAQARANIGALTESEMIAYVEESILGGAW
jgi:hypothetical protein